MNGERRDGIDGQEYPGTPAIHQDVYGADGNPPTTYDTPPQYSPTQIPRDKRCFDIISAAIFAALLLCASLFAASMYITSSPDMSLKEFLDRSLLNSQDGTVAGYRPGDNITITDRISEISLHGSSTMIKLRSIEGTRYSGWAGLEFPGDLTGTISHGDRVEVVFRVGLSEDGNREILMPLEPSDITLVGG